MCTAKLAQVHFCLYLRPVYQSVCFKWVKYQDGQFKVQVQPRVTSSSILKHRVTLSVCAFSSRTYRDAEDVGLQLHQ